MIFRGPIGRLLTGNRPVSRINHRNQIFDYHVFECLHKGRTIVRSRTRPSAEWQHLRGFARFRSRSVFHRNYHGLRFLIRNQVVHDNVHASLIAPGPLIFSATML